MKIWGCQAYVKRQAFDKLRPKSDKCYFMDYPKETKWYYFYNPIEGKVFVTWTSIFLEKEFISRETNGRKIQLEEIQDLQNNIELEMELDQRPQTVVVRHGTIYDESNKSSNFLLGAHSRDNNFYT